MILIANSLISEVVCGSSVLSLAIFMLLNDIKQIVYQDSFCIFRAYITAVLCALSFYSFLLQAIYRYISVYYPNRVFWRSIQFQILLIFLTWLMTFLCMSPLLFTNEIVYNVDNQICQISLQFSFSLIYSSFYIYTIPISMIMFIYLKLVLYVKRMSKRITPINTLSRVQRELKMVRRIVILVLILLIIGIPYELFIFLSFFNSAPKYHFRIAFLFIDASILVMTIILFHFTKSLKTSLLKIIKR